MTRFGRLFGVALLLGLLGAILALAAPERPASAETGIKPADKCEISSSPRQINVLMLLDASGSLRTTDPDNSRRFGLEAAVVNLANLAGNQPDVHISIAVDTFSTKYSRKHGWQDAETAQRTLSGRYAEITALAASTDYRQAIGGAAERFRDAPAGGCNLLLWFTDGEHATEGTSSHVSEREWEQLRTLCASAEMRYLAEQRDLYSVGVLLSSPETPVNAAPLRHLFGEGTSACRYALDGEIKADVGASDLRDELDELINEVVYEVNAEADTSDDLPREESGLPDSDDYDVCSGGDGTAASPCVYSFSLDPEIESFRVFVDMTFLGRRISNPGAVNIRVRSPQGIHSEPVVSAAQKGADAQQGDAVDAQYQPVRPFWFLSQRPYDSRWEIIGHQAAEQLAKDDWDWAGEWSLLFWGDTPEAEADARRVAAAFRAITVDAPSASMNLNDEGKLIGFIENFPSGYSSVELNLEPRDADDEPVYTTRPNLRCESADCNPVPVSGDDRFEVADLFDEVVWWDSEVAGGDGLRLESALERGQVSVEAVLDQEFLYGGVRGYGADGEIGIPLIWSNDIGRLALEGLDALLDGKDAWEELLDWLDSETSALPFDLRLLPDPYDIAGDNVVFRVEVSPGYYPGVVTLEDVRARADTAPAGNPNYDAGWSCEVPGTEGRGDVEPTTCRAVRIDLGLTDDSDVTAQLDFLTAPVADLEDIARSEELTVPSEQDWTEVWGDIQRVAEPRSDTLESAQFRVDLPTPTDRLSEFLPILVALLALAAVLRVFVAWRLRPWPELHNPEYVIKSLDTSGEGLLGIEFERHLCMDLTANTEKAALGGVEMFSRWLPLLCGRPPSIEARSARAGGCVGPKGCRTDRKGARRGIIGHGLRDGWILHSFGQQHELILWDLPADEMDQQHRVAETEDGAREWIARLDKATVEQGSRESTAVSRGEVPATDPFTARSDPSSPASDPFGPPRDPFE